MERKRHAEPVPGRRVEANRAVEQQSCPSVCFEARPERAGHVPVVMTAAGHLGPRYRLEPLPLRGDAGRLGACAVADVQADTEAARGHRSDALRQRAPTDVVADVAPATVAVEPRDGSEEERAPKASPLLLVHDLGRTAGGAPRDPAVESARRAQPPRPRTRPSERACCPRRTFARASSTACRGEPGSIGLSTSWESTRMQRFPGGSGLAPAAPVRRVAQARKCSRYALTMGTSRTPSASCAEASARRRSCSSYASTGPCAFPSSASQKRRAVNRSKGNSPAVAPAKPAALRRGAEELSPACTRLCRGMRRRQGLAGPRRSTRRPTRPSRGARRRGAGRSCARSGPPRSRRTGSARRRRRRAQRRPLVEFIRERVVERPLPVSTTPILSSRRASD